MKYKKTITLLMFLLAIGLSFRHFILNQNVPSEVMLEQNSQILASTSVESVDQLEEAYVTVTPEVTMNPPHQIESKTVKDNSAPVVVREPVPVVNVKEANKETTQDLKDQETEEEIGISIIQIALMDNNDGLGDIIYVPKETDYTETITKRFHVYGNSENDPLTLIVNTQDEKGIEIIQFLDWDPKSPNDFKLHSALGSETVVTIYKGSKRIDQFSNENFHGGEIITLNINLGDGSRPTYYTL